MEGGNGNHGGEKVEWVSFPAKDEGRVKTAGLFLLMLLTAFAMTVVIDLAHGLAAFLLLFLSMNRYFFPSKFSVSDMGVDMSFVVFSRHRNWRDYARYRMSSEGVFFSPFAQPSRLDSFRGDFLKFSPETDIEGVKHIVVKHLDPNRKTS